jgi:hypothetical protein
MDFHPSLEEFKALHGNVSKEKFLGKFHDPFLVVDLGGLVADSHDFRTLASTSQERPTELREKAAAAAPRPVVAILTKTGRNSFNNMITLGRAGNNDVVVPHASISKFHSFFRKDFSTGLLSVWDAGSKYGTSVNGILVKQGQGAPLESGATLVLARSVPATYFTPDEFYEYMFLVTKLKGVSAGTARIKRP